MYESTEESKDEVLRNFGLDESDFTKESLTYIKN